MDDSKDIEDAEGGYSVGLEDDTEEQTINALSPLVADVREKYEQAKRSRYEDETRWGRAYYNYRGLYGNEVAFTDEEKSKVFIKVTKTKTLAAYGQLLEVIFADGRLPINVEPTPVPEGIEEVAHVDLESPQGEEETEEQPSLFGYDGDGEDSSKISLSDRLVSLLGKSFKGVKATEGAGYDPKKHLTVEPAALAAKKMDKKIHDQFVECDLSTAVRKTVFEQVMLGTGILKGPFAYEAEYPQWDEDGTYNPVKRIVPKGEHTSLWNFYPDPEAYNLNECDWVIERHKMTKSGLRNLRRRPFFRKSAIEEAILDGPNSEELWWESEIEDDSNDSMIDSSRWDVIEYWGVVDRDYIEDELDQDIPKELQDEDEFQVNIWVCGNHLIRVVLNPFTPRRIPYHVVPYEMNPYSIFGVGVPENMEDCQQLMNGFTRLAVDNAVLSGNLMIEVDSTNLKPGTDMKLRPGKVWERTAGAPGQAVFGTKFPNTSNENMMMFDKFRQIADDATGMPSYSHGQTGVSGTTRTASGMSMLMGAASLNIKTVVKNIDDYLMQPIGEAFFRFNMQFNFDPDIRGDLSIHARGTQSLMQREVKSQRIMQFMQIGANPMTAPFINFEYLTKEAAKSLDLDPEKAVNDPKRAMLQAQMQGQMGPQGQQGGPEGPSQNDPTGTGGGMIGGAGQAMPGSPQFTGNEGGGGMPQDPMMQQQQMGPGSNVQ